MEKEVYLKIDGRVQGIGYRRWAVRTAAEIGGVWGWVRNGEDGSVEIHMSGEEDQVNKMIQACYRGPMLSRVDNIRFLAKPPSYFLPAITEGVFTRI